MFPERIGVNGQVFEPLHGVPVEDLMQHPFLIGAFLLSEIWSANCTVDEAAELREALRVSVALGVSPAEPDQYFPAQAMLVAVERLDDDVRALALARELERKLLDGYAANAAGVSFTPLHLATPFIFSTIAETGQTSGDLALAARCFQRAAEWAELLDASLKQHRAATGLAAIAAINGETRRAQAFLDTAGELAELLPAELAPRGSLNDVVAQLLIAAEARDVPRLTRLLDSVTNPHATVIEWPYLALAESEVTRFRDGNLAALAGLDARVRNAERYYPHRSEPRHVLEAYAAQILATHGNYRAAQERLERLPAELPDAALGRGRIALLQGDAATALTLSSGILNGRASTWLRIAARLVRAAAEWDLGERGAAIDDFEAAAEAIAKHGTSSGLELIPDDTLRELVAASGHPRVRELAATIDGLPDALQCRPYEALTEAELRILEAVAGSTAPLPTIAETQFVTAHTVKFHLRSIYRKLRVQNREGAVARAHEIGLVSLAPEVGAGAGAGGDPA